MTALAKELVDPRPNAILGVTTPVVGALAHETKTIPIVFTSVSDPIGSGFAANLAHPGTEGRNLAFVTLCVSYATRFATLQRPLPVHWSEPLRCPVRAGEGDEAALKSRRQES